MALIAAMGEPVPALSHQPLAIARQDDLDVDTADADAAALGVLPRQFADSARADAVTASGTNLRNGWDSSEAPEL